MNNNKKAYSKMLMIWIIGLIVLAVFLIWRFWGKDWLADRKAAETQNKLPVGIEVIEQGDKKIVRNTAEGYEVTVPKEWEVNSMAPEYLEAQSFPKPKEAYSGLGGEGCGLSLNVIEDFLSSSIGEWANKKCSADSDCEKITEEIVKINNSEWHKIAFWGSFLGTGDYAFYIVNKEKLYKVDWACSSEIEEQKYNTVLEGFLSSINF